MDNYGGDADQLDCIISNLQLTGPNLATTWLQLGSDTKRGVSYNCWISGKRGVSYNCWISGYWALKPDNAEGKKKINSRLRLITKDCV